MKKLTIGLAALLSGYAANSFAALPTGVCSRCDVNVPNFCGGFTFGLTGLYWRATSPQLDYALTYPAVDATTGAFLFSNGTYHHADHDYDWGFKANIGYIFPCSGNDIMLTYTHWNDDHDHRVEDFAFAYPTTADIFDFDLFTTTLTTTAAVGITGTVVDGVTTGTLAFTLPAGTAIAFAFDPADVTAIAARSKFENHTWDLDFGQTINVGCNFRLRWFGGLRYTKLEHDLDTTNEFTGTGTVVGPTLLLASTVVIGTGTTTPTLSLTPAFGVSATLADIVHQKSDFDGIGPRFGLDASYHLGGGFGVVGSLSTALLVGEHEATYSERLDTAASAVSLLGTAVVGGSVATIPGIDAAAFATVTGIAVTGDSDAFSFKHPDETRVVPNIDAKLGLDWTYQFCNCSRTKLTIEAGYMVSHYFNAIDRLSGIGAFAPELRSRDTIDASFDGPYVGVQVVL